MYVRVVILFLLGTYMMCVCVLCQRDILVAGTPNNNCEGSCSAAASPPKIHHPHPQDARLRKTPENRKNAQVSDTSERLIQLQRCMLQHESVAVSQGDGSDSLVAFLALMAAVLTECDLHCHSQRLRQMATRLGYYIPQYMPLTSP